MGMYFECQSCEFEFCSGHSSDVGASNAICARCCMEFRLPTKSAGGPNFNELVELHGYSREQVAGRKRKKFEPGTRAVLTPTGQHIMAVAVPREDAACMGIEYQFVEQLRCPGCKQENCIRVNFEQGSACPQCKRGKLKGEVIDL